MLQNCEGVRPYSGSVNIASAVEYQAGDILLSNIRPYLKKLWQADRSGACSPDVLVMRPNSEKVNSKFIYYYLRRDKFFDFIMNEAGTKGAKMPRGDKESIIKYEIAMPSLKRQEEIVSEIERLDVLIDAAKKEMAECLLKKQVIVNKYICLNN